MAMTVRPAAALTDEQADAVLPQATVEAALKVTWAAEAALLATYQRAAIDWCERYTAKAIVSRSWVARFDRFGSPLRLPREPVTAVTAVGYLDAAGVMQVLAPPDWRVAGAGLMPAIGATWPAVAAGDGAVTVTFTAGFADVATEAPGLVAAMLLVMGHLYRNRETVITGTIVSEVPFGAAVLADQHSTPVIG